MTKKEEEAYTRGYDMACLHMIQKLGINPLSIIRATGMAWHNSLLAAMKEIEPDDAG